LFLAAAFVIEMMVWGKQYILHEPRFCFCNTTRHN
jgi:hypothetical protein